MRTKHGSCDIMLGCIYVCIHYYTPPLYLCSNAKLQISYANMVMNDMLYTRGCLHSTMDCNCVCVCVCVCMR